MSSLMVCRICMKSDTIFYTIFGSIKGRAVTDIIFSLTGLEIKENDGLPNCVCMECNQKLENVNDLRETCLKSYEKFIKMKEQFTNDLTVSQFEFLIKAENEESYEILEVEEAQLNLPSHFFEEAPVEEEMNEIEYLEEVENIADIDEEHDDKVLFEPLQKVTKASKPQKVPIEKQKKSVSDIIAKLTNEMDQVEDILVDGPKISDNSVIRDEIAKMNAELDLVESTFRVALKQRKNEIAEEKAREAATKSIVRNVRCCGCSVLFDTIDMLEEHSKNVHLPEKDQYLELPYQCKNCFKTFLYEKSYNLHINFYAKNSTCPICSTTVSSMILKKKHISIVHDLNWDTLRIDEAPIKCCACYQNFDNYDDLFKHAEEEHKPEAGGAWGGIDEKPYACDVCFKGFNLEKSIPNHKAHAYQQKKYQCSHCGKAFAGKCMMKQHEQLHFEGKKHQCPKCQSQFKCEAYLLKHMDKMHTGRYVPQIFLCPNCGKSFKLKQNMLLHVRQRHLDVSYRPFECLICKKRFNMKAGLEKHMRNHLGVKPYKCQFCEEHFVYYTDCKRHEVKHTGIYPYHCDLCGKPFIRLDSCRKHKERCTGK